MRNCRWRNTSGVGSQIQSGMLAETVDVQGLIAGKTPSFTVLGSWTSWLSCNPENTSEYFDKVGFNGIKITVPCAALAVLVFICQQLFIITIFWVVQVCFNLPIFIMFRTKPCLARSNLQILSTVVNT